MSEQAAILSDEELQDLAQRAIFLRSDPTAGSVAKTTPLVLVAIAVILIVVLIVSIRHQFPS
ncbi:MAG: hypothetical protein DMF82_03085 [Acidobacteria bacterium]|nr:MAG: hypothetical protein DMF82_03085 [Acidobacteriota bacterium]